MNGKCPECNVKIHVEDPEVGEILDCDECGVEFEVITVSPLEFSIIAEESDDEWSSEFGDGFDDDSGDSDDHDDDDGDEDEYEKDVDEDDDYDEDLDDDNDDNDDQDRDDTNDDNY